MAKMKTMDGNTATAWIAYALSDTAAIYPISPSSVMGEVIDDMASKNVKNVFGQTVSVREMQSEAGAAGAVHGMLASGSLASTYTASQGLLLMIPNMYKIAGELLPGVFHVAARALASHALCIFGDHQDVMACRQTGFSILCSNSVQECMDLALVAHLSALESSVPMLHFFDGFRTSHEIQKIEVIDYDDIRKLVPWDAIAEFRARGMNPEHPETRGTAQNPDIYFQNVEAANSNHQRVPAIVEANMKKVAALTGREHHLFEYVGDPEADRVIISMGSSCEVIEETVNRLNAEGERVGLVKVHLFRPFAPEYMLRVIPSTVSQIAVLDRTKEPGSLGEPLYQDVCTAFQEKGGYTPNIVGGRYGLGSKDTPPASVFAVYEELKSENPKRQFTIGIVDDVTNLSLPETDAPDTSPEGTIACKFWGLGGDGTVGAHKNSIKIIGDHTDKYVQAYFQYDSKKTGGVTISHLRFGDHEIKSPYYINKADFVACHNPSYITKGFKMVQDVKPGGVFMINCEWTPEELSHHLDASAKRYIARNNIQLYTINAIDLAIQIGMGKRNNTILQSAFFSLAKIMPEEDAIRYMKEKAKASYMKKGEDVVEMNYKAIDLGATAYVKIDVPADWANAVDEAPAKELTGRPATVKMVRDILTPVDKMDGDSLPVSAFVDHADGTFELGASAYEKRGVAVSVPEWDSTKCIQCNQCAYVCPHATIRPFALTADELAAAPAQTKAVDFKVGAGKGVYKFSMAISPLDCMGCGVCTHVCPVGALTMQPLESQEDQQPVFDYMVAKVAEKKELQDFTVKGSQFRQPMLEFSGSCAGCAETSYARLITQLFGDHMMISNATGCSSIWGGPAATSPYTVNKEGKGPAWANSLFEDNAEHGLGMYLGQKKIRDDLAEDIRYIAENGKDPAKVAAAKKYLETYNDGEANQTATAEFLAVMEAKPACDCERYQRIMTNKDFLNKKSCWIFGGDGWAYDIGFGGLDHVLAQDEDVNVFVFNTEVYSNTGGQASKASNIGQVAQFAAAGKELKSKSLAEIAMSYGYIYVAQVAMGANPAQTIKAIKEAEAYPGPSLIIGYAPCEMHSIKKGGMTNCQGEMKRAVDCGYWNLFRYDPSAEKPFALDSKEPAGGYRDFLMNEARYARLTNEFPERAEELFAKSEANAKVRYEHLLKLKQLYDEA